MPADPGARVQAAIERLDRALRGAGVGGVPAAAGTGELEAVAAAIRPYSLPPDLHRFWERASFAELPVGGFSLPGPLDPRGALETYRLNLEPEFATFYGPPLLFPIARISGDQWSVELSSRWSDGGSIVSHGDAAIRLEYPSFADLLETYASLLEHGRYAARDGFATLDRDAELSEQAARCAVRPHPHFGETREIPADPARWPPHWLLAAGLDARELEPRGRTHTVSELVAAAAAGPLHARIRGELRTLLGVGGDILVRVTDETGALDVWCRPEATRWMRGGSGLCELDLVVSRPVPQPLELAATSIPAAAPEPPAVVATAVRPLP